VTLPTLRLLDTDVVIDLQHKRPAAVAWFSGLDLSQVAVPGIVAMELYQKARNKREARSADAIIRGLAVRWPSEAACNAARADFRALHLSHSLGLLDALIGATARELGATLCTFNVKHFKPVPNLTTEQPYTR
jgi:predicted nucleic acid-binding protein